MAWACVAAKGTVSLTFIDDITADTHAWRISEVYGATLSAQIQPSAAKLLHITDG